MPRAPSPFHALTEADFPKLKGVPESLHQMVAVSDAKTRELWQTATGIDVLPRVLLIDSNGIIRSDSPQKLDEELAKLLRDSPSHP